MANLIVPENLPDLLRARFHAARECGAITFWPTEVSILEVNGVPFQLRLCTALAKKPKADKPRDGKPFDPFLDPSEVMLIAELPPSHILVLNKFAVVREHFILATKTFKKQTDLLEADDLWATFACLKVWRKHRGELFAFFNSGEHSGASQPHRHIQLLPVEFMMEGLEGSSWKPIVDMITSTPKLVLPFTCFSATLPKDATPLELYAIYIALYKQACHAVDVYNDKKDCSKITTLPSISYNLGMTDKSMVLCPRRAEGTMINSVHNSDHEIGPISLNGTLLAGTLLVKNEEEWKALKEDASQLTNVLSGIGIPSSPVDKALIN